jgi:hypothetical protein
MAKEIVARYWAGIFRRLHKEPQTLVIPQQNPDDEVKNWVRLKL